MFQFKLNLAKWDFCVNEPGVFLRDKNPLQINCFLVLGIVTENSITVSVTFQYQQQTNCV